ncbi:zinc finger protein 184-like [Anopheles marshallii]|uniref:zinc finger protein 184-like n=1 Tax=Anopheles marshallii TaxID=1521116 RepID=UPI00237B476C|nr:zinc finger protein 184-like [Anopheles marshallii]
MAIASQEMFQICRFCLCQDEALLIPLEDILDFTLAFQDVSAVTGLEINQNNSTSYAMCLECTTKLKSSVAFREACRTNDIHFQELCAVLSASFKESRMKIIDTIQFSDNSDESMDLDLDFLDTIIDDSAESSQINDDLSQNENIIEEPEETAQSSDTDQEEFSYCANYILPGENLYSADEDIQYWIDWDSSLNPSAPPPAPYKRGKREPKYYLCDICGRMVKHIPSHVHVHTDECTYSCEHCPVKFKQKTNLIQHIKTVHLKTVTKTCEICGKGFVHHKTYRYHMLTHQGEGKTFECLDCSRTFSNSVYLRDHINRLHNAEKQMKKKDSGDRIRRKRSRSNTVIEKVKDHTT